MSGFFFDLKKALELVKDGLKIRKIPIRTYAKLYPYLVSNLFKVVLAIAGVIIVALLGVPTPLLLGQIIDNVLPSKDMHLLINFIILLSIIQLLTFTFSFVMNYYFTKLSQNIILSIKQSLFAKVLKLPCSFFDKTQTGYLVSRLKEVDLLDSLFSPALVKIGIQLLEAVFCLIVMFFISWKVTLFSLIALPIVYYLAYLGSAGVQAATNKLLEQSAVTAMNMQESLTGIEIVKLLSKEQDEVDKFNLHIRATAQSNLSQSVILSLFTEISLLIAVLEGFIVLLVSGYFIVNGELSIGSYLALSGLLAKVYGCINSIVSASMSIRLVGVALDRIFALEEIVSDDENPERTVKIDKLIGEIIFKNVSFYYIEGIPVFTNFSVQINPGEKVLIYGESGSGKSTLFKLLLGRYSPQDGIVTIDGIDLSKIDLSSLRENVSIVTQNMFLFNDTIMNNIMYGRSGATKIEAISAAKLAGAHDFILKLEKGYETLVGERGVKLSGGQLQRISIARALVRKSNIILFDEAISHLDDNNVALIHEVITKVCKDKTCLVISHRTDSRWMDGFDKIVTIRDGKLSIA